MRIPRYFVWGAAQKGRSARTVEEGGSRLIEIKLRILDGNSRLIEITLTARSILSAGPEQRTGPLDGDQRVLCQ